MWDIFWKCALTGLVVGAAVGYLEREKNDIGIEVGARIDELLTMFTPPASTSVASAKDVSPVRLVVNHT